MVPRPWALSTDHLMCMSSRWILMVLVLHKFYKGTTHPQPKSSVPYTHSHTMTMMTLPMPCSLSPYLSPLLPFQHNNCLWVSPQLMPCLTAPQCHDHVSVLAFTLARSGNGPTARSRSATNISEARDKQGNWTEMHPRTKIFAVQTQARRGSQTWRSLLLEVRMPNL